MEQADRSYAPNEGGGFEFWYTDLYANLSLAAPLDHGIATSHGGNGILGSYDLLSEGFGLSGLNLTPYLNNFVAPVSYDVEPSYSENDIQIPSLNNTLNVNLYEGVRDGEFGRTELQPPVLYINPFLVAPLDHDNILHNWDGIPGLYNILNAGEHENGPNGDVGLFGLQHPAQHSNPPPVASMNDDAADIPPGNERVDPPQNPPCAKKCKGNLIGSHACSRRGRALQIRCLGSDTCAVVFETKNDFNRHFRTVHRAMVRNMPRFECSYPGCNKVGTSGFSRKDNLVQHRRKVHGENIEIVRKRFSGAGGVYGE